MTVRVFNFEPVNKGALLASVSVDLGGGIITHHWRILRLEGQLTAGPPQVRRGPELFEVLELQPKEKLLEIQAACVAFYLLKTTDTTG